MLLVMGDVLRVCWSCPTPMFPNSALSPRASALAGFCTRAMQVLIWGGEEEVEKVRRLGRVGGQGKGGCPSLHTLTALTTHTCPRTTGTPVCCSLPLQKGRAKPQRWVYRGLSWVVYPPGWCALLGGVPQVFSKEDAVQLARIPAMRAIPGEGTEGHRAHQAHEPRRSVTQYSTVQYCLHPPALPLSALHDSCMRSSRGVPPCTS